MWVSTPGSSVDARRTAADGRFPRYQENRPNGVDNCARIFDGDTFAGAIPAGVNQTSLRACCLHTFHRYPSIPRRVQRQERGAEAGAGCGGRSGDAAFGAGQFSGETRQEVVLRPG